ncbi:MULTISPECIES: hypothetical protein [unclassified Pseudomonas]|uniref:hypothetical protein n=1 Tax=unclassified Pseudomonas TaxID=196821 RepID=UPI002B2334D7|nr:MULTISPECIES: hypothetical protein [unclassified Pseudomonas]MEA9978052.1 hypothetical protein [Pseudomonas sp. RTS4]MEB0199427.1 hypothetical protein [Pseudomonas sp. 5S4]MEB0246489.1 hypothetical protein [Pseudomonas sp. 10S5]
MSKTINPAAGHQEDWNNIANTVRPLLSDALSGLNPDEVFINGVNNLTERLVISSTSITNAAVQCILDKEEPAYSFVNAGLFSVAYSFADEHRMEGPDASALSEIISNLVRTLG